MHVGTTQGTLANLASTTASQLKQNPNNYRQLLDTAIRQVSSGTTDFSTAMRSTMRSVAKQGVSYIDFDTNYKRRLDSQIRMNILDGVRTNAINVAEQCGEEYGADGVEISAHGLCATDHLFIQGKQYAKNAWEKINASLVRAIGTLNCKHFAFPILLGISTPAHTQKELDAINKTSTGTTTIGDKTKSGYEWTQEQRKLETLIREQKDVAVMAAKADNMTLRREAQAKINKYKAEYAEISKQANLIQMPERMTVSGFHRVKAENQLKSAQVGGIITSGATSGALSAISAEGIAHAEKYYESVRKMTTDIDNIVAHTGVSKEIVSTAKTHLFMTKHDLGGTESQYFVPDYDIAQSWQRLSTLNSDIEAHDLILLEHENMEATLMSQGMTQQAAHDKTNEWYNYQKALEERG